MSISITSVWARWGRLCIHGVDFYPTEGLDSLKFWRVSCGSVVLYVNQVQGLLKCTLHNCGGAQVRCPGCSRRWSAGGEKLTLWSYQDKMATRVGVACGVVIYKQYVFMVEVDVVLRNN